MTTGDIVIIAAGLTLVMAVFELLWDGSIVSFLIARKNCSIRIRFREFLESYRVSPDRWKLYGECPVTCYGEETVSFTTVVGYLRYRRFVRRERRRKNRKARNEATDSFRDVLSRDIRDDTDAHYRKWMETHNMTTQEPGEEDPNPTYFIPIHDYNSDSILSDVPRYVPARYENGRYYIIKGETERR